MNNVPRILASIFGALIVIAAIASTTILAIAGVHPGYIICDGLMTLLLGMFWFFIQE